MSEAIIPICPDVHDALDQSKWGVFEHSWMAWANTLEDWDWRGGNVALAKRYEKHYVASEVKVRFKDGDLWDCLVFPSEEKALMFALEWR